MTGLRYVYAVCRPFGAALQSQLTGLGGDPPRLLSHHGLIAVVSHVPERDFAEAPLRAHLEDLEWLTATARAHQLVIDALTAVTGTRVGHFHVAEDDLRACRAGRRRRRPSRSARPSRTGRCRA